MTSRTYVVVGSVVVIALFAYALITARPAVAPTVPGGEEATSTPAASVARTPIASALYRCDGGRYVSATYFNGPPAPTPAPGEPPTPTGSVDVSLDGAATSTLAQTLSADGTRYANRDGSFVFWNKGDTALIMRNNAMDLAYTNCSST